jgi:peroxiredoxin
MPGPKIYTAFLLPVALVTGLITMVPHVTLAAHATPWEADELIGRQSPDFTLRTPDGGKMALSSLSGKVVLVNFWATWCEPCREEMPSMNKLYNKLKNKGFVVLAVSSDNSPESVRNFIKKVPVDFPVLLDEDSRVSVKLFKVFAQPMSFLIDKKGRIVKKYFGSIDWTDKSIVEEIEVLLR